MLTDPVAFAENVNVEIAETKLAFGCKSFANLALDSKLLRVSARNETKVRKSRYRQIV